MDYSLVSIDTLYMPNDLDSTLAQVRALLKTGGRMAIYYSNMIGELSASREALRADQTISRASSRSLGKSYQEALYGRRCARLVSLYDLGEREGYRWGKTVER
jgi:hypothetical protein